MVPPIPNFDEFSKKISKGFDQVKQRMGTAEDTTNFPPAYVQLDAKVDKLKLVFDAVMRVTRQLHPPIGDSIMDAMDRLGNQLERLRHRDSVNSPNDPKSPILIYQETSNICLEGADLLAKDNFIPGEVPAANMLQKYGQVQGKLAEIRQEFNRILERKFLEPFGTYQGAYDNVNKARKNAQRVRLELDASKARLRNIRGMRPTELQGEVDNLEKEFSMACDDAIQEMKTFIQYTEATHCIEALMQAQLNYHRKSGEVLAALI